MYYSNLQTLAQTDEVLFWNKDLTGDDKMAGNPVIVFASFSPNAGQEGEVEEILKGMIGPTRAEPSNEIYDLYKKTADSDSAPSFHLFERYTDADALQAHRDTDHYKAYRAKITDYLSDPIGVVVLDAVDAAS